MLDGSEKDYVVYRSERTGNVFQCHKATWREGESVGYVRAGTVTLLVNNVTQKEAWQFCQLTKEN